MSSLVKLLSASIVITVACGGETTPDNGNGYGASGDTNGSAVGGSGDTGGLLGGGSGSTSGTMGAATSGTRDGTSGTRDGTSGTTAATGSPVTSGSAGTSGRRRGRGMGPSDAGAAGPDTVPCGRTTCQGATPVCCVAARAGGDSCAASAADCETDGGRLAGVLSCSGKATCMAGDVCCVGLQRDAGLRGGLLVTECLPQCTGGGGGGEQVCTADSDCPAGDRCALQIGGGLPFSVCVPVGGIRPPRDAGGGGVRPPRDAGANRSDSSAGNNDM